MDGSSESEGTLLNILIAYLAIGIACTPITFYLFYTSDEADRREEPLVFWLVALTICTATVPLWPVFVALLINHFMVERKSYPKPAPHSMPEWIALKESWKKITALSDELDAVMSNFLESAETQGDSERRIRKLLSQIEQEYDLWSKRKSEIPINLSGPEEAASPLFEASYLRDGPSWPRVKVSIDVEVDPVTNTKTISHSTVRLLFPEVPSGELKNGLPSERSLLRLRPAIPRAGGEPHPWRVTISGRFNKNLKKLRGDHKDKVVTAVNDIVLSPTSVMGDTKAPLSNNLRDFWRVRVGDWRIIYTVDRQTKTVTMLDYIHRSKAYR